MIPKTIHYCWFGGKPKPKSVQRCIDSWKKYCPDYEVKEWNEQNYDVNRIPYTRNAYQAGKYAFVSDVARFLVLYQEGGVYFDTDVEAIKPIDNFYGLGTGRKQYTQCQSRPWIGSPCGIPTIQGDSRWLCPTELLFRGRTMEPIHHDTVSD